MLLQLTVSHYAIARALEIDFRGGMTALTGETGAGKSILLDALGLALGDRADPAAISPGEDRADICATFDIAAHPEARAWLAAHDFPAADDGLCLLKRVILREGRSRAAINGQPATLAQLRELGGCLIDIHHQHEHQSLLQRETQRSLLDAFGQHAAPLQALQELAQQWRALQQRIDRLQDTQADSGARLQLLQYQVEELDRLAPQPDEVPALETEQKQLANAGELISTCEQLLQLCREGERFNVLQALFSAQQLLARSPVAEALPQVGEMLGLALIQVEEAAHDLQRYRDQVNPDPERLHDVEQRLATLHDLARKHRVPARELPALHERLHGERDALRDSDGLVQQLQAQQAAIASDYTRLARDLSTRRRKAAKALAAEVNERLQQLNMAHCQFGVDLIPHDDATLHLHGAESVEFLISTQPGAPARPLARVASGGELSRVSLAIQVVTAGTSQIPTLVFDEVDVGIGGPTAVVVGKLLRALGEHGQVLCVTHQAAVAARAHHHLYVSKDVSQARIQTRLCTIEGDARVDEIARMIGGETVTPQSRAHAEAMLAAG